MTEQEVLLPAEAAQRLGVATRVVLQARYEGRLPRVRLGDGTLVSPAEAIESFHVRTA